MIDMHSDFRFALHRNQYKGSKCWAGGSISSRISRNKNLKFTWSIVFDSHIDVHIQLFSIIHIQLFTFNYLYQIVKNNGIWKIRSFYCCIRRVFHLRYLYHFYHSRATRTWSVCNEMYHNVFRYEYLTF